MNTDPINVVLDNRRASPRRADNAPIKVRRPGSLISIPATVVDRSDHGVGIVTDEADHTLMPGSAIELLPVGDLTSPVRSDGAIRATVAWVSITGTGARAGIRFHVPATSAIAA